jgi:hypothetical protein
LFHIITEGKAIWYNSLAFIGKEVASGDLSLATTSTVQMLQYVIITIGFLGSSYAAYKMGKQASFKAMLPYYGLMLVLGIINIYLFSLPMSHRV